MQINPLLRTLTPVVVYLNAAIWLGLGLLIVLRLHPAIPEGPLYQLGMGMLSLLTGSLMIVLYRFSHRWRPAYFLLVGMYGVISVLAFTDDFGLVDLMALIINLTALIVLVADRGHYLIQKME